MEIKSMFLKPIDRNLKGVIKIDQEETVAQELEEYVVTTELQKLFSDFFAQYRLGINGNLDEMGVWISGFFGSGKSHFLKILSHLLDDRLIDEKRPIDYFLEDKKITDEIVLADMRLANQVTTDVISFNIDSKSDSANKQLDKETILSVFLKAFNQQLGYYGANPHLADLERSLERENLYESFKETFKEVSGRNWLDSRSEFRFVRGKVSESLVKIGYMEKEAAEHTCDSLTDDYALNIEDFSKLVLNHCKKRGNNHHVLFMVDEMGQYIGDNTDLMLNLQTVTEDLGTYCKGKAWVMVTSQEDIDSITKTKGNDFSKIQGRFHTRLTLSSANADEVICKRVLKKTEDATLFLKTLYEEKETIIKNLLVFNDGIEKKLYSHADNFAEIYPFIPYQFRLLQSVLTAIRQHGASGKHLAEGERSMLALFKDSAHKKMNESHGTLMPFYLFYDEIERFLDAENRKVIIQAESNAHLESYDVKVLKTLFLIKYVKEIKANVENITTLMVENIDVDRITLLEKVEESLKRLVSQTLVLHNGDIYTFLSNEEQEINREINQIIVEEGELVKRMSSLMFDDLFHKNSHSMNSTSNPLQFNQLLDGVYHKNNQNGAFSLEILTPNYDESIDETVMKLKTTKESTVVVVLPSTTKFVAELRVVLKIERYLTDHAGEQDGRNQVKEQKRHEKSQREKQAKFLLEEALNVADIYTCSEKMQINSKDFKQRITSGLDKLVTSLYHQQHIITEPMTDSNISALLQEKPSDQIAFDGIISPPNQQALFAVDGEIARLSAKNGNVSLKQILDAFNRPPYGFTRSNTQWLVAKLFKQGDVSLSKNKEEITTLSKTPDEIFALLTLQKNFESLQLVKRVKASEKDKEKAAEICKELFQTTPTNKSDDIIMSTFLKGAQRVLAEIKEFEDRYYSQSQKYPCQHIVQGGKKHLERAVVMKNSTEFYQFIKKYYGDFMDFTDEYKGIREFFNGNQLEIWHKNNDLLAIYVDSENYISSTEILDIANTLLTIQKMTKPFPRIKELTQLRTDFLEIYGKLLNDEMKRVLPVIDAGKKRVLDELEGKLCHDTFHTPVDTQFNKIKEKAETAQNVAVMKNISSEVDALKTRLLDQISEKETQLLLEEQKKQPIPHVSIPIEVDNEAESVVASVITSTPSAVVKPLAPPKQQKHYVFRDVNPCGTWRIETESDLDKYLAELRESLKEKLHETPDKTITIEF